VELKVKPAAFFVEGEADHVATLQLAFTNRTPVLNTNMGVFNSFATVNWTSGNVTVNAGKTITNNGTFNAFSAGTIGNNLGAGSTWNFVNNRGAHLTRRNAAQFTNIGTFTQNGNLNQRVGQGGAASNTQIASVSQTDNDALANIESGTMTVTGDFSQPNGNLSVKGTTTLSVTGDFTESSDAVFGIELKDTSGGSGLVTVGGTVTLDDSVLAVTTLSGFRACY
jgi:hypothetical protein